MKQLIQCCPWLYGLCSRIFHPFCSPSCEYNLLDCFLLQWIIKYCSKFFNLLNARACFSILFVQWKLCDFFVDIELYLLEHRQGTLISSSNWQTLRTVSWCCFALLSFNFWYFSKDSRTFWSFLFVYETFLL